MTRFRLIRAGLLATALASLSACAEQSCRSPAVLNFLDASDAQANLSHLGLVRDAVRTDPGPTADSARCTIWERVRGPIPDHPVLVPQSYQVQRISTGWKITS